MGQGLKKQLVNILAPGGIDTKTDPRQVTGGKLLEVENMYYLRAGELRQRFGMRQNTFTVSNVRGSVTMFGEVGDDVAIIAENNDAFAPFPGATLLKRGSRTNIANSPRWLTEQLKVLQPHPRMVASLTPVLAGAQDGTAVADSDLVDPDVCVYGPDNVALCWTEAGGAGTVQCLAADSLADIGRNTENMGASPLSRPGSRGRLCGGSAAAALFYLDTSGTPSLVARALTGFGVGGTVALNDVSATEPWFDVILKQGTTDRALVAWRAASSAVIKVAEWNMTTGAIVTGPVTVTGADAWMSLGWLQDNTGASPQIITAGAAAGIVTRQLNPTTLVSTATVVIDAGATANVRSLTGHVGSSGWRHIYCERANATTSARKISHYMYDTAVGAGSLISHADWLFTAGLNSKAMLGPDGRWYLLASYDSPTQSVFVALYNPLQGATSAANVAEYTVACQFAYGSAGGIVVGPASPTSGVLIGSQIVVPTPVKTKVIAANGSFSYVRSLRLAALSLPRLLGPRRINRMTLMPGGVATTYDGQYCQYAAQVVAPEPPTVSATGGGSMTPSKTYSYRACWAWRTADGVIWRSPPSPASSVTLGAGDSAVSIAASSLCLTATRFAAVARYGQNPWIEIYRAGPAEDGATAYNRVGATPNVRTGGTVNMTDTVSDANANAGELLYTSGNVLEHGTPPCSSILHSTGNRFWMVSAEEPEEVWFSKEVKPGAPVGWNAGLSVRIGGDSRGAVTALSSIDTTLVAFKATGIYVISGDGPNDQGQGAFQAPRLVSSGIGTTIPASVVETPEGVMFQSPQGICLLTRGHSLDVTVGAPVDAYTRAESCVGATLVYGTTQVRFAMPSGRILVYDYLLKTWTTFTVPVGGGSIYGTANRGTVWSYLRSDFHLYEENTSVFSDEGSVSVTPRIVFPGLAFGGLAGFERLYELLIRGEYVGAHTLSVQFEWDDSGSPLAAMTRAATTGTYQVAALPAVQKGNSLKVTITTTGTNTAGGLRISGIGALVGIKRGSPVPSSRRLS